MRHQQFNEKDLNYVIVTEMSDSAWVMPSQAEKVQKIMRELGWNLEIRLPIHDETQGTYLKLSDGNLRLLGFSIDRPKNFVEDLTYATDLVLNKKNS